MSLFSFRSMTKVALVAALAAGAAGCTFSASGRMRAPMIVVAEAPPPPRAEPVRARANHVWIAGYHRWDGNRYVWQDGRHERMRPGYVYAPGRWQRQGNGHVYIQGEWRANGRGRARGHRKNK